jgi:integrase/recombinase XerD
MLAAGVAHLDPASAVFEAMLAGWATQQRARFLKDSTVGPRLELVRRFAAFTNQYPVAVGAGGG